MRVQLRAQRVATTDDPFVAVGVERETDRAAFRQIAHLDRAIYQLIHHQLERFVVVRIAADEIRAVVVDAVQTDNHLITVHIDAHLRIDRHIHRSERLLPFVHAERRKKQTGDHRHRRQIAAELAFRRSWHRHFHDQIFHERRPPFRTCCRWPRTIS